MVRTPRSLSEAKTIFREERRKVTTSLSTIAGSRWLLAILATFVMAFGSHALFAPERLPVMSGLSIAQIGLPPSVDFGFAGEQIAEARAAAQRENAPAQVQSFIEARQAADPNFIRNANMIGFGVTLALLLGNMWLMTKRRRVTRG